MRPMFVCVAYIFLINVLAAPTESDPSRGNAVALRRRSPNEHDKAYKHATPNELVEALKSVNTKDSLLERDEKKKYTWVYHLTTKINDENLILKVIRVCDDWPEERIMKEGWALYNVGQWRGWAHTPDREFYYLFMKNMGVPLQKALETSGFTAQLAKQLREKAHESCFPQYHIHHVDHDTKASNNWVYREVGGEWEAVLIDWFPYVIDKNWKHFQDPPEPFVIDQDSVPKIMLEALNRAMSK